MSTEDINLFDEKPQVSFMKWEGGECPTYGKDVVCVEHRDGTTITAEARTIAWNHLNVTSDVLGWRMVQEFNEPETEQSSNATKVFAAEEFVGNLQKVTAETLGFNILNADFLKALAAGMSYNNESVEATVKHRLNEIAMQIETADVSPFTFKMGQYVKTKNGNPGIVIGRAEFHDAEPSYLLRMDGSGNREAWLQSLLSTVS